MNESKEVNRLTMIGFALFGIITITNGKITLSPWMILCFLSWCLSAFFHYYHNIIGRDSQYMIKKNKNYEEIEKIRDKNIEEMNKESIYQIICIFHGFLFFIIGLKDYPQCIETVKNIDKSEHTLTAIIFMTAFAFIIYKIVRFQITYGVINKLTCGIGFALASLSTAISACSLCKNLDSTIVHIILIFISTVCALISISLFLHSTCGDNHKKLPAQADL